MWCPERALGSGVSNSHQLCSAKISSCLLQALHVCSAPNPTAAKRDFLGYSQCRMSTKWSREISGNTTQQQSKTSAAILYFFLNYVLSFEEIHSDTGDRWAGRAETILHSPSSLFVQRDAAGKGKYLTVWDAEERETGT